MNESIDRCLERLILANSYPGAGLSCNASHRCSIGLLIPPGDNDDDDDDDNGLPPARISRYPHETGIGVAFRGSSHNVGADYRAGIGKTHGWG